MLPARLADRTAVVVGRPIGGNGSKGPLPPAPALAIGGQEPVMPAPADSTARQGHRCNLSVKPRDKRAAMVDERPAAHGWDEDSAPDQGAGSGRAAPTAPW